MAKHGLSEDEVADLKEAFNMFDIDGDGMLSKVLKSRNAWVKTRALVIIASSMRRIIGIVFQPVFLTLNSLGVHELII